MSLWDAFFFLGRKSQDRTSQRVHFRDTGILQPGIIRVFLYLVELLENAYN